MCRHSDTPLPTELWLRACKWVSGRVCGAYRTVSSDDDGFRVFIGEFMTFLSAPKGDVDEKVRICWTDKEDSGFISCLHVKEMRSGQGLYPTDSDEKLGSGEKDRMSRGPI